MRFAFLAVWIVSDSVFAQTATPPPAADPLLAGLGELVSHAKLGRTVLAVVIGVKLVIELLRRFGKRIPGPVGAWFASPMAAWALPLSAGVVGGIATALANGGSVIDSAVGGLVVGIGAWLPTPEPKTPPTTTPQAVKEFNASAQ